MRKAGWCHQKIEDTLQFPENILKRRTGKYQVAAVADSRKKPSRENI
jgi:hypothetical protein